MWGDLSHTFLSKPTKYIQQFSTEQKKLIQKHLLLYQASAPYIQPAGPCSMNKVKNSENIENQKYYSI